MWHTGGVSKTATSEATGSQSEPAALCCAPLTAHALDDVTTDEVVTMLKALADPIRLKLINIIAQTGEVCACDLPAALDRSQPTISHHLSVLVKAGLLHREKRGKWAWFRVRSEQLDALSDVFAND